MLQDALFSQSEIIKTNIPVVIIWIALTAVVFHLFAGLRHLTMDFGFGESKKVARITAYLVLIFSVIFSVLIGLKLC